ncbi:hypothetical protein PGIGA_G00109940 [Pangasianodon gigas]|uniref:Uncharacterized protein n=1 Tax=Pangasianodon gigas TaxID=30993 RepID=A0ACC5W8T6_PANGG|nr:hypothetical protein [Pangasianodon gigas]
MMAQWVALPSHSSRVPDSILSSNLLLECFLNSSRDATVSNAELRSEFSVSESQESHTGVLQLNISPYHITQVCVLSSFFFLRPQCLLK